MNVDTATAFINANKGNPIAIVLNDGTEVYGDALSVNSKGVNVKVDGKTRSVSLARIQDLDTDNENDTYGSDDEADDIAAAEIMGDEDPTDEDIETGLADGMSTRELADVFGIEPKELRVHLRALGLGVGKGRTYSLAVADYRAVKALVAAN